MVLSNVIVDITISSRSFVFSQSDVQISAGLTNISAITTLRQLLTNVKDKDEPSDRRGAVYKIKCCDCQATYITNLEQTPLNRCQQLPDLKLVSKT